MFLSVCNVCIKMNLKHFFFLLKSLQYMEAPKSKPQAGRLAAACSGTQCSTDLLRCCPFRPSASWWRWSSPCAAAGRWVSPGAARCRSPCCPAASGARCDTCIPQPIAVGDESHQEMIKKSAFHFTRAPASVWPSEPTACISFSSFWYLMAMWLNFSFSWLSSSWSLRFSFSFLRRSAVLPFFFWSSFMSLRFMISANLFTAWSNEKQTLQNLFSATALCSQCGSSEGVVTWVFSVRSVLRIFS